MHRAILPSVQAVCLQAGWLLLLLLLWIVCKRLDVSSSTSCYISKSKLSCHVQADRCGCLCLWLVACGL